MTGITFEVPCTWGVGTLLPEHINYKGKSIKVVGSTPTGIMLSMHMDLTMKDHITAVKEWVDGKPLKPNKALRVEMPLNEIDLDVMESSGVPIWDSIFRKPEPIIDLADWADSPFVDQYIYLPNQIRKQGLEAEEYITNAHYTEVLANAYRGMCEELQIKPSALLADGSTTVACCKVNPHDGSQPSLEGARSARLANSKLCDFDDSAYAKDFIRSLMALRPYQYESESVLRTVLAKAEYILMGKTSHTYNQKFMKRFMERFEDTDQSNADRVLHILSGMITEGLILEDSGEQFKARIIRGRLDADLNALMHIFEACHGE